MAFPVAHRIPVNQFVGAQVLAVAETGVAPKLGALVEAGENAGSNALPRGIACTQQEDSASRFQVPDQRPYTVNGIGWNEFLFGENIHELLIVIVSESQVMSFFYGDSALLGFANAATTGVVHGAEEFLFRLSQVGAVRFVELASKPDRFAVLNGESGIGNFHV